MITFVTINQQFFYVVFLCINKFENDEPEQRNLSRAAYAASIGRYQQTRACLLQRYRLQGLQRRSRVLVR